MEKFFGAMTLVLLLYAIIITRQCNSILKDVRESINAQGKYMLQQRRAKDDKSTKGNKRNNR